jgi:hypothetical protein
MGHPSGWGFGGFVLGGLLCLGCSADSDEAAPAGNFVPGGGRGSIGVGGAGAATAGGASGSGVGGGSGGASSAGAAGAGAVGSEGGSGGAPVQPGQLTAADWDDNLNFEFFQNFLAGATHQFGNPVLASADRVEIRVATETGAPLSNARVEIRDASQTFLDAPTASDGRLLFFPAHDGAAGRTVQVAVTPAGAEQPAAVVNAPPGTRWDVVVPNAGAAAPTDLDLAFVLDTTGSMGDELRYLTVELDNIVSAVRSDSPTVSMRFGLVVYRDQGDVYVTRRFDFTNDLVTFKGYLSEQQAGGGGDTPEAADVALADTLGLSWRGGNVARVAFLVADAPPHQERETAFLAGVDAARKAGIKLYPVAASGVDDKAEFLWRLGAEWTLARYLFITDDSGIGGDHAEPHIPCFEVTRLNALMTRMVRSELAGHFIPPSPQEVLRAAGNPAQGVCRVGQHELFLYPPE